MAQSIASDGNGNKNARNGSFTGFNGQLQHHLSQSNHSLVLGNGNYVNNYIAGNGKQGKDSPVLVIHTYVSPEGQGSFQHGTITDNVIQDLDKSGNTSEDKKRRVLSIQTYTSPEGESPNQHGIITHTVYSELEKPVSLRKLKERDSKSGKGLPIQNGPESPVLAVETTISPDGQPPFFKGKITNTVYTELDKSKEHNHRNGKNLTMDHTTLKFNKDHKDGQAMQTVITPEEKIPSQHGTITKTLVSELNNNGSHREKSNIKSKDRLYGSNKGRSSSPNGSESPVLAVETLTSQDGHPPFFKGTITNTVYTELHKPGVHNKRDVPSTNLHKNKNTEAAETGVLY